MNIIYAVAVLGGLALFFGTVLAVASKVFEVQDDPRLALVQECLPGANCGGCGYPGCAACAAAIVSGSAPVNACPGCSGENVTRIAAVMGVDVFSVERRVAFVRCSGGERANHKFGKYVGVEDCFAAMKVGGNGFLECASGCLGLGTCVKACKFDAIRINELGVAEVDRDRCTGCMRCAAVCPKNVIVSLPYSADLMIPCSNREKGALAKSHCAVSCIGCRLCERNCPAGAITVTDNMAVIDYSKCTSCGACAAKCPRRIIINIHSDGRVAPCEPS